MTQMFFAPNWYWQVGGNGSQVYSSQRNIYVPTDDSEFVAWLETAGGVSRVQDEAEIWAYVKDLLPEWLFDGSTFAQPSAGNHTTAQLRRYAAAARYAKEIGGIVISGMPIATDRESQSLVNGAYSMAALNPEFTTQWKAVDGTFVPLDAALITAVAQAVAQHVANCFAKEAEINAGITAGTVTTKSQVDAALA